jgi:hypothetical protein
MFVVAWSFGHSGAVDGNLELAENIMSDIQHIGNGENGGNRWSRRIDRAARGLAIAFAALVAGSRSIPLGDNGSLIKDLAARAGHRR